MFIGESRYLLSKSGKPRRTLKARSSVDLKGYIYDEYIHLRSWRFVSSEYEGVRKTPAALSGAHLSAHKRFVKAELEQLQLCFACTFIHVSQAPNSSESCRSLSTKTQRHILALREMEEILRDSKTTTFTGVTI
jgi:hypothetical protein